MTRKDLVNLRLVNHGLSVHSHQNPKEVVAWMGALQAQDFNAAKWSLGIRLKNWTDNDLENSFNSGELIRTHVLRPTWHFISPEDVLWMQKLTSNNVKKLMTHYNKKLELTDELFKKTERLIVKRLKNYNYLTRQEIKKLLIEIGIATDVQRLAHIVMWLELDGIVCSGPLKGKQFTYALVEERTKNQKNLSKEESLGTLATKYFQSHGPAQLKDFSWWSGLSAQESYEAMSLTKSKLAQETINNKKYWFFNSPSHYSLVPSASLLSIYDEYVIAYKDRSDLNSNTKDVKKLFTMGNALTAVIIINGQVIGTWKRLLKKNKVIINLSPFKKLTPNETRIISNEVAKYANFLNLEPIVS